MRCKLCGSEVDFVANPFGGYAEMICRCRTVQFSILGVIDHAGYEAADLAAAGTPADSSGGGEAPGRDDSAAQPERVEEAAAADEDEVRQDG